MLEKDEKMAKMSARLDELDKLYSAVVGTKLVRSTFALQPLHNAYIGVLLMAQEILIC